MESSVISIEPITALNTFLFKAVRFRALQDAPHAFGSTYAEEAQLTDSDWIKRVERWNGESGAGFSRWIGILRSEERRVGKERISRWRSYRLHDKENTRYS